MPKVLFISHSASRTGAPIVLLHTARALAARGFDCAFVVGEEGPLVQEFQQIGETVVEPLYPAELKYWREIKRVSSRFALLRRIKPTIVYCNTIHTAKWLLYARMAVIKTVLHVHELSMGFANLQWQEHFIIRKYADRYIAVSEAVRVYLIQTQKVDGKNVSVVPSSIDSKQFAPERSAADSAGLKKRLGLENAFVIGNVGRITRMKGTDLLLDVAAAVKTKLPGEHVKYLLIATTDDPAFYSNWKSLVRERDLQNDFIVVENQEDVAQYYALMDAYVSTAREDPFPLVILEAMAAGVPVAAFAVGGIPEQLAENSGVLVEGLDVLRLTEEIVRLVRDSGLRAQLGSAGQRRVRTYFDTAVTAPMVESILRSMNA